MTPTPPNDPQKREPRPTREQCIAKAAVILAEIRTEMAARDHRPTTEETGPRP